MINFTPEFDLESIVARAKAQWMVTAKRQVSIQERIALTVPWWLIIIAAGLFALSVGHTVGVFSHLSPIGYAGPFVVEFSLLWAAFARGVARQGKGRISLALQILEIIAFVMAIAANGIGAMSFIAEHTQVSGQSWANIIQSFGLLPVSTQLELLFVPLFALFIPLGTWVAGEGIANLILTERRVGSALEQRWREVEPEITYKAIYLELVKTMSLVDAKQQASRLSAALSAGVSVSRPRIERTDSIRVIPERVSRAPAKAKQRGPDKDARSKVRAHLDAHPEDVQLSVRALASVVGIGHTIAGEEKAKWKQEHGQ